MFTTKIVQLDCRQNNPFTPECVEVVHYQHTKSDYGFTAQIYGTITVGEPDPNNYTPFQNLDEAQVIAWCNFDNEAIEAALDAQLMQMYAPPVIGNKPPWEA